MSSTSFSYLCPKQEVCLDKDEPISDLPPKRKGELLNIDGDPDVEEDSMFEIDIYFSVFYCLYYVKGISEDMLE